MNSSTGSQPVCFEIRDAAKALQCPRAGSRGAGRRRRSSCPFGRPGLLVVPSWQTWDTVCHWEWCRTCRVWKGAVRPLALNPPQGTCRNGISGFGPEAVNGAWESPSRPTGRLPASMEALASSLKTVCTFPGCGLVLLHLGRTLEGISPTAADALLGDAPEGKLFRK